MADRSIITTVRRYLAQVRDAGVPAVAAVLYGSFARGQATPDSDIDLLILSPAFDGLPDRAQVDKLWELTWRVDSRIEPVPVGLRQYETDNVSPLIQMARREGVLIQSGVPSRVAESPARYLAKPGGKKSKR